MSTTTHWPRFQADNGNTGHVADVTAVPETPEVYWDFYVTSSPPAVADGNLFTIESRPERSVVARDAATGTLQWTTTVDRGGAMGMPSVSDESILVQSYGLLFAIDRQNGDVLWEHDIGRGTPGCPVVADDVAYFANGAYTDWPAEVFAFDISTGERQWQTKLPDSEADLAGSVAVNDDYVFIAAGDIRAYDLTDGSEVWQTEVDSPAETTPTVFDGAVYVTDSGGTLHAIRTADGSEHWTADVGEPEEGTAVTVANEEVYVGTKSGLHSLTTDGETRWQFDVTNATSPTVGTDAVYVGESGFDNRAVYAVTREDGSERWRYNTEEQQISDTIQAGIRGPPTLVESGVYVVAADGIRAFGREST